MWVFIITHSEYTESGCFECRGLSSTNANKLKTQPSPSMSVFRSEENWHMCFTVYISSLKSYQALTVPWCVAMSMLPVRSEQSGEGSHLSWLLLPDWLPVWLECEILSLRRSGMMTTRYYRARVAFCPLCKLNPPDVWSLNETGALIKLLACGGSGWLKNPAESPLCAQCSSISPDTSLLRSGSGPLCWWFSILPLRPPSFGLLIVLELPAIRRLLASTWPIFPSQRLGHSFTSACQLCHICCGRAILSQGCEGYNFFMPHARVPFWVKSCAIGNTNCAKFRCRDEEGNSVCSRTLTIDFMCKLRRNLRISGGDVRHWMGLYGA